MKKAFVVLMIMLLPLSAMAMTPVSDSELAAVSGQQGVSIAVVDMQMDVSFGNIAWGDLDYSGLTTTFQGVTIGPALFVAGYTLDYKQGYINFNDITIDNIFITLNPAHTSGVGLVAAEPLEIDIASTGYAASGDLNPFATFQGKTALAITMGDMLMQIEEINVGGIYLDDGTIQTGNTYVFVDTADRFVNVASTGAAESLGTLNIDAMQVVLYSSVEGWNVVPFTPVPVYANHPARVYIWAHD